MVNSASMTAGLRLVTAMPRDERKTNGTEEMFVGVSQKTRNSSDRESVDAVITRTPPRDATRK